MSFNPFSRDPAQQRITPAQLVKRFSGGTTSYAPGVALLIEGLTWRRDVDGTAGPSISQGEWSQWLRSNVVTMGSDIAAAVDRYDSMSDRQLERLEAELPRGLPTAPAAPAPAAAAATAPAKAEPEDAYQRYLARKAAEEAAAAPAAPAPAAPQGTEIAPGITVVPAS